MTKTIISQTPLKRARMGTLLTVLLLLVAHVASHTASAEPQSMKVRVTFYSPTSRGKTATGRSARLPGVAVDPRVIPLGSRVTVPGFGIRVADDTGSAIKGHRIDVRLPVGKRALARKHGVKHLRVRIVTPTRHRTKHRVKPHTQAVKHGKAQKYPVRTMSYRKKSTKRKAQSVRHAH